MDHLIQSSRPVLVIVVAWVLISMVPADRDPLRPLIGRCPPDKILDRIDTRMTMVTTYPNGTALPDNNITLIGDMEYPNVTTTITCSLVFRDYETRTFYAPFLYHIWLYNHLNEMRIAAFHPNKPVTNGSGRVFVDLPIAPSCGFYNVSCPENMQYQSRIKAYATPEQLYLDTDEYTLTVKIHRPDCCDLSTYYCWYYLWEYPCPGGFNHTKQMTLTAPCDPRILKYQELYCNPITRRNTSTVIQYEICSNPDKSTISTNLLGYCRYFMERLGGRVPKLPVL